MLSHVSYTWRLGLGCLDEGNSCIWQLPLTHCPRIDSQSSNWLLRNPQLQYLCKPYLWVYWHVLELLNCLMPWMILSGNTWHASHDNRLTVQSTYHRCWMSFAIKPWNASMVNKCSIIVKLMLVHVWCVCFAQNRQSVFSPKSPIMHHKFHRFRLFPIITCHLRYLFVMLWDISISHVPDIARYMGQEHDLCLTSKPFLRSIKFRLDLIG